MKEYPVEFRVGVWGVTLRMEVVDPDVLKLSGLAETGGEAKLMVADGEVLVNGEVCTQRGKKLRPGDTVSFGGETLEVAVE